MRKLFQICLLGVAMIVGVPAIVQAQGFIVGIVVGMALSSDGKSPGGGDMSNVLYLMPRATERIRDPLELHTVASHCDSYGKQSLRQVFKGTVHREHADKEILQVVRVPCNGNTSALVLWFVFTDKSNLRALAELPQLEK